MYFLIVYMLFLYIMKIKDKLTVPLYEKSFDGDSYHSHIKFENMDVILSAQENIWSWIIGLVNVILAFIMFYPFNSFR